MVFGSHISSCNHEANHHHLLDLRVFLRILTRAVGEDGMERDRLWEDMGREGKRGGRGDRGRGERRGGER